MPSSNDMAPVAPFSTRPKVRERNRRRVLDAAHHLVASGGLDNLSMRALADAAGVSATTLYNLFGTKDGIVRALATDILGVIDAGFDHIVDDDAIDQLRARVLFLVEVVIEQAPASLVSAVLEDTQLTEQLNAQWPSRGLIEAGIRDAIAHGLLIDTLDPAVIAEHVRGGLLHEQRLWAAMLLDDDAYRARAAYTIDLALLAIASDDVRARLEAYLRQHQRVLRRAR